MCVADRPHVARPPLTLHRVNERAAVLLILGIAIGGCSHRAKSSDASKPTVDLNQLAAVITDSTEMPVRDAKIDGGSGELRITLADPPIVRLDSVARSDVARGIALFARAHYARMSSVSYIRVVFVSTKNPGAGGAPNEVYEARWRPDELNPPHAQARKPNASDSGH
jgi:hypothetical protein